MDTNSEDNLPQFLTPEAVAKMLNVSKATIFRYLDDTENPLPAIYLSDSTIRIPWEQFQIWLDSKKKGGEFK